MSVFIYSFFFLCFSMSCNTFWTMWVSLEIFTLFISSFLSLQKGISKGVFNYFIVQMMGSALFLLGMLMTDMVMLKIFFSFMGLFMKAGAFPFHSWTFSLIEYLNWKNIAVMFGLPKFIPLWSVYFISSISSFWFLFYFMILFGSSIPSSNLKIVSIRSILAYSTVVHTSWILAGCFLSKQMSFFYFFFYVLLFLPLCFFFFAYNIKSLKDLVFLKNFFPLFFFANFSGLPPFLGFFSKFIIFIEFFKNKMFFESGILGILAIFPIFLYMKMFFFSFLKSKLSKDFFFPKKQFFFSFFVFSFCFFCFFCFFF